MHRDVHTEREEPHRLRRRAACMRQDALRQWSACRALLRLVGTAVGRLAERRLQTEAQCLRKRCCVASVTPACREHALRSADAVCHVIRHARASTAVIMLHVGAVAKRGTLRCERAHGVTCSKRLRNTQRSVHHDRGARVDVAAVVGVYVRRFACEFGRLRLRLPRAPAGGLPASRERR